MAKTITRMSGPLTGYAVMPVNLLRLLIDPHPPRMLAGAIIAGLAAGAVALAGYLTKRHDGKD